MISIGGGAGAARAERRRWRRRVADLTGMLRPLSSRIARAGAGDSGGAVVVHVFDLSAGDVGFVAREPLQVGEVFRISLCDKHQHATRAQIHRCRRRDDGRFEVGAVFC